MNKNILSVGITILLLCITVAPLSESKVIEKSDLPILNGNILYVGGSGEGNYTSIQDAIDNATSGDTVLVFDDSSPYYEHIFIDKSINLIGEKRHSTIIDGSVSGVVVSITADRVTISRFTIQNGGFEYYGGMKVRSNHSIISENNIISNNRSGLVLYNSNGNTISSNTIKSNQWSGIILGSSSGNIISDNIIISNDNKGVTLHSSNNNTIAGNIVSKNEWGINLGGYSKNNTVSGNIVMLNEYGIRLYQSNNNTISKNSIRWNMYGLSLLYSYSTKIMHNNFIRNILQAYFDYYLPDGNSTNCGNGNFWNRPRILPKPILGSIYVSPGWIYDPYIEFDRSPALIPNRIGE